MKKLKLENREEIAELLTDYELNALMCECEERKISIATLLLLFIYEYGDDEFFDYCMELCEKHHIELPDDEDEVILISNFHQLNSGLLI